jgi:hypothetical protein
LSNVRSLTVFLKTIQDSKTPMKPRKGERDRARGNPPPAGHDVEDAIGELLLRAAYLAGAVCHGTLARRSLAPVHTI